ncbi:MAG: serine/threonine protein kinase [Hyphomonadaceae bacterium]|nr:serine/threonine protein kinase [Hyphomonadaceae bacterium]
MSFPLKLPAEIQKALNALEANYTLSLNPTQGANGYVFRGQNKITNTVVAIKFYFWDGDQRKHLEPQAIAQLKSPHILEIFDAARCGDEWAYFVTRYCTGGDLDNLIPQNKLSTYDIIRLVSGILSALTCLHPERYIHRDLKPANIYLQSGRTVIGDFGSITRLPDNQDVVAASKHAMIYRPPESVTTNEYGVRGDIYQAGLVLYQLCGGFLPYDEVLWLNKQQRQQYEALPYPDNTIFADQCICEVIANGDVAQISSTHSWISDALRSVIRKACAADPATRFASASAFQAKLQNIRASCFDWKQVGDVAELLGSTSYRVTLTKSPTVYKRRSSDWRKDNSLSGGNARQLIKAIERTLRA